MSPVEVSATAENRIKGMIGIRDCVRNLIELQTEDYPDSEIKQAQDKLNTLYDSFTKKYGLINSRANTSAFSDDSSYALPVSYTHLDVYKRQNLQIYRRLPFGGRHKSLPYLRICRALREKRSYRRTSRKRKHKSCKGQRKNTIRRCRRGGKEI